MTRLRHLVAGDLCHRRHERIGERVGGHAGAVEDAARGLDIAVHFRELPADALKVADRLAEHRAVPDVVAGLVERAFGQPERDAGVQATLGVEGGQQLAKAVLADHEVLQRQFAIVELDLVQVFAAHGVIGAGHLEARRVGFQQHAADALAAGLAVDPGEDHEHAGLAGAADQGLGAVEDDAVALDRGIGAVVRDIGAGMRLGHADRQDAFAGDDLAAGFARGSPRARRSRSRGSARRPRRAPPSR